ncbi:MAG: response regulator [Bacteroidetes bacterium]|nr:response regulator [Bacteroidota bacterium]
MNSRIYTNFVVFILLSISTIFGYGIENNIVILPDSISDLVAKSNDYKNFNIEQRESFAIEALEKAKQTNNLPVIIVSIDNIAQLYMLMGKYYDAEQIYNEANELLDPDKFPELAVNIKNQLGNLLRQRGIYYLAVENHHEALRISETYNYLYGEASSLNYMGMVYRNLEKIDKAREYYDAALKISLPNDFHKVTIRVFNNIGTLNIVDKNFEMAFFFYDQAFIMATGIEDIHSQAIIYNNIGNVYREMKELDLALSYYLRSDSVLKIFYNIPLYGLVTRNQGVTYLELKQYDKAESHINEGLLIMKQIGLRSMLINFYSDRARLNFEMGKQKEAYEDMLTYVSISKELNFKNLHGQANLLEARKDEAYEINKLYQSLKQRNSIIYFFAIFILLLLSGLLIVFYRSNRDKKSFIAKLQQSIAERDEITSALRKSEDRYSKLIKTMNEGLIMADENDNIQFANSKACQMLSATFEQIKMKPLKSFIGNDEQRKAYLEGFELRKIGVADQFEIQLSSLDDDDFWGHFSVSPLLDENQKFYGSVIVLLDVTENKKSNYQLQEATANLNQKIKQLNCLFDVSDLTSVPGITFEELLKKAIDIIPNGIKYSHDVYVEVLYGSEVFRSENYIETPWVFITPIKIQKKKLGHIKIGYLEEKPNVNKDPFQFSEKILIKSIAEKLAQIIDSKNMEQALNESHEKLYQAQKIAKIGNWEWDLKSGRKVFSESYFDIMCVSPEKRKSFNDDDFRALVHPEDRKHIVSQMHKIYSGNVSDINSNYRIVDFAGTIKHIRATSQINFDDKLKPILLIGTVQDVTEQVANQELKNNVEIAVKISEMKQQFLANMSHEMRTPMNGILGMIDFLLKTTLSEEQLDYANTIKHSSESLLNIINDVLDLSKIEAGKLQLKPVEFNLYESLERIKGLFAALTKQKVLSFSIEIKPEVPEFISADENRLMQVFTNLISNAVKFTPEGGVKILISLNKKVIDEVELYVEVTDSGIGISEESMDKLFQPFTQIDTSLKRVHEGTGLGLSICRSIVKLMGGEIGVKNNEEGHGTTFFFTVKVQKLDHLFIAPKEEKPIVKENLNLDIDILLVEDKIINQKIIRMMLENAGCRVKIAYNGQQALDILEKGEKFDLIIMDIQMPVMDGVTANKHMKTRYKELPPVIALSANALEGDAEKYINAGMDDYISKPVKAEDLYAKIIKWTNKSSE